MQENFITEMSLYRALTVLKTLDSRLLSKIHNTRFCGYVIGEVKTDSEIREVAEQQKSFQSINDLISYRRKVKSAISLANATTMLKIGELEMSISEALEMKSEIKYKEELLKEMHSHFVSTKNAIDSQNDQKAKELANMISSNSSNPDFDIKAKSEMFWQVSKYRVVDGIGIEAACNKMRDEIAIFKENVDVALAETNAKTIIKIK